MRQWETALSELMKQWEIMLSGYHYLTLLTRLLLAMILGGFLGMERGRKRRAAGFRTYMAVSVGAALVMCTAQFIFVRFGTGDPSRMGAQVISGIGFLGAGTILVTQRSQVKGLTTAAGLWVSACIGLASGIGFYSGAIIATILIFIGMTLMHRLEYTFISNGKVMDFFIEFSAMNKAAAFMQMLREQNITISDIQFSRSEYTKDETVGALLNIKFEKASPHAQMIELFTQFDGVRYVEEIL